VFSLDNYEKGTSAMAELLFELEQYRA